MTRTATAAEATNNDIAISSARWAWWGVAAGSLGLFGVLVGSHGNLSHVGPAEAVDALDRTSQHIATVAGMASFFCLALSAAGWRRWSRLASGLAEPAISVCLTVTATLVLFGVGLCGALAEYLPGGANDDNFGDDGLFVLFILHDTAPWTAWWGVLAAAPIVAWLSFRTRLVPRWLGVASGLAVLGPVVVLVCTGAVAGGGLTGPLWLAVASSTVAVRGLPEPRGRS